MQLWWISSTLRMTKHLAILCLLATLATAAADRNPPEPIPGATEFRDVRYLPDWRYPEAGETLLTNQMRMDIAVPDDGKTSHPTILVVHGGGWSAGTKEEGGIRKIMTYFVERGYVAVGFNYILRPRGIMPQVFWDTETALRFLRKNAEQYRVDPARIGAIGLSAGGWLISSVGHSGGDLYLKNHQHSTHIGELWERDWRRPDDDWNESFIRPLANPDPIFPDEYGRFQAISMDFHFRIQLSSGNSPAMNNWMGEGGKMRDYQEEAVARGEFDYTETLWTHPKYRGKSVHVPNLFKQEDKNGNLAAVIGFDGQKSEEGIEAIYRFFQHHLVENPRTPVPAIRPASRFFAEETEVRFVMPKIDHEIRYQILPLERIKGKRWDETHPPVEGDTWKEWPKYTAPFRIDRDSLVRAVATSKGRRPSTIAEAHFFRGVEPPPHVTAPEGDHLPPGRTGERYEAAFESDAESPRLFLAGDLVPWRHKTSHYPNNMILDRETGIWSGTPTKPGKFWVQIWVNGADGAIARHRDYLWIVEGEDLSSGEELFKTPPVDPYVELAHMPESNIRPSRLAEPLRQAGIPHVFQDDDSGALILVPEEHTAEARKVIETRLKEWKHTGSVDWRD